MKKCLFMLSHNTCTVRSAHGPKATFSPERRQVLVQTGQGNQIATRLLSRGKEQESMCACVRVHILVIFHTKDFYSAEDVATSRVTVDLNFDCFTHSVKKLLVRGNLFK